jgi:hypothetical protein
MCPRTGCTFGRLWDYESFFCVDARDYGMASDTFLTGKGGETIISHCSISVEMTYLVHPIHPSA